MNKQREIIFNKFGGKCAYCGCDLVIGWHVDEIEPCRRKYKIIRCNCWVEVATKKNFTINEVNDLNLNDKEVFDRFKWVGSKTVLDGYTHPERLNIDNQMPACASCNINKHSMTLEDFRRAIQNFMKHLNEVSTQYKIAKRYGLIQETAKPVIFYFETLTPTLNHDR